MIPLLRRTSVLVLCLLAGLHAAQRTAIEQGSAEQQAGQQTWTFTPDPALPDVLILGDSISIGYTLLVRKSLAGVANVHRPVLAARTGGPKPMPVRPANCFDTGNGLRELDGWLQGRTWRVIHFNFGLHDLKYIDDQQQLTTPDLGKRVTTPDQYEANLRQLVTRMKKTGAILVWADTTPVPVDGRGRIKGDERIYNAAARRVMVEQGVLIDDLNAALGGRLAELQKPENVHFTDQGSQILAEAVTASIRQVLAKPWTPPVKPANDP